jgi:hypothetical protein
MRGCRAPYSAARVPFIPVTALGSPSSCETVLPTRRTLRLRPRKQRYRCLRISPARSHAARSQSSDRVVFADPIFVLGRQTDPFPERPSGGLAPSKRSARRDDQRAMDWPRCLLYLPRTFRCTAETYCPSKRRFHHWPATFCSLLAYV